MGSSKSRHNRENQVKTLVLLLLISSSVWGQDTTNPVFRLTNSSPLRMIAQYNDKDSALRVYLPNGDTVTHDMKRGAIPPRYISLADWDEWKDSCSVLRPYETGLRSLTWVDTCRSHDHMTDTTIKYAHFGYATSRADTAWGKWNPDDLQGFMEFIKRRMK